MERDTGFRRLSWRAAISSTTGRNGLAHLGCHSIPTSVAAGVQNFALSLAKGCAKCRIWKRTARKHWNACVPLMRFAVLVNVSSYSALPAFIWRLPITSIAVTNTARRTAATKTKTRIKLTARKSRLAPPSELNHRPIPGGRSSCWARKTLAGAASPSSRFRYHERGVVVVGSLPIQSCGGIIITAADES
jgi:hypothetical protein